MLAYDALASRFWSRNDDLDKSKQWFVGTLLESCTAGPMISWVFAITSISTESNVSVSQISCALYGVRLDTRERCIQNILMRERNKRTSTSCWVGATSVYAVAVKKNSYSICMSLYLWCISARERRNGDVGCVFSALSSRKLEMGKRFNWEGIANGVFFRLQSCRSYR